MRLLVSNKTLGHTRTFRNVYHLFRWIGGLRTRKAKVTSSILMGGSQLDFFGEIQSKVF